MTGDLLSLVLPAYNEQDRLDACLQELTRWALTQRRRVEILVVANGCTDQTVGIAEWWEHWARQDPRRGIQVRTIVLRKAGKGAAVRIGMLAANGFYRALLDVDLSVGPKEIDLFLHEIRFDPPVDVLIADRLHPDSRTDMPFLRYVSGRIYWLACGLLLGTWRWQDTQCGAKLFTAKAAADIFSRSHLDGFSADLEWLLLAKDLGYRIRSVPVTWIYDRNSKVRLIRDSLRMLKDVWRLSRSRSAAGRLLSSQSS
jgi:dolichyl-phosphate beta-glucosyltransferase